MSVCKEERPINKDAYILVHLRPKVRDLPMRRRGGASDDTERPKRPKKEVTGANNRNVTAALGPFLPFFEIQRVTLRNQFA